MGEPSLLAMRTLEVAESYQNSFSRLIILQRKNAFDVTFGAFDPDCLYVR